MSQVLTFTVDEQDMVSFAQYVQHNLRRGDTPRRWPFTGRLVLTLFVLAYFALDAYETKSWVVLVVGILFAGVVFLLWPIAINYIVRRQVRSSRKLQGSGAEESQQIWLDDMGFHVSGPKSLTVFPYAVIQRIDDTPSYVYILISQIQGVVIPKFKVDPGQLWEFLAELHARLGR